MQKEGLLPKNHVIRKIDEVLNLEFLYKGTEQYYSHEGKLSIDPVVLFKIYIIGYFFGISSERQLFRDIQVNLAYLWYLGYDLDEDILNHSIMTKSRYRFPRKVFDGITSPEKMGKRRNRKKKNENFESQTDPDAEIISRPGKGTYPSYKAHMCVDRKHRV